MRPARLSYLALATACALAVPQSIASAATNPSAAWITAGEDPDVEVPSDPAEPLPAEASLEEKEKAGLVVGIPPGSWQEYAKNDLDFTFALWRRAKYPSEVKAGAELAHQAASADSVRCDACSLYIRSGIGEAHTRDKNNEIRDTQVANEARERRMRFAMTVGYRFPHPEAIAQSDRHFIFAVWDYLRRDLNWAARTIAAAGNVYSREPQQHVEFLSTVGMQAFHTDRLAQIDRETAGNEAARIEAIRRDYRRKAAIAVGVHVGTDESWYLISDLLFLTKLRDKVDADPNFLLTKDAFAAAIFDGKAPEWRAFIEAGVHEAVRTDEERRAREQYESYRKVASRIRDEAEREGLKNIAVAGNAALASGRLLGVQRFIQTHAQLPPDSSDLTALYDNGKDPSSAWVFGQLGRKIGKARKVWTGAAGDWRASRSTLMTGQFDAHGARDAVALYRVREHHYRLDVFADIDSGTAQPRQVWEMPALAGGTGYALRTPVATDVNGDGWTDLAIHAVSPTRQPELLVLMARRDGSFTQVAVPADAAVVDGRTVAGDVNRDGRSDLVTLTYDKANGTRLWVRLATADGYGVATVRWTSSHWNLLDSGMPVAGDFDRDGVIEIGMFKKESRNRRLGVRVPSGAQAQGPDQHEPWSGP
ncbi:hypothetical protein GCM10010124_34450 [Pilimelia terevasa]|uniref:VCBS repeat-containing protein n=2 Tax=Pilimelia terevasa TaxID=53372 RepID=A0A8J3BTA5_9ACTN|nr:hypothetical protein GCM10010124_34450 [Pilimelia terevasa]